MLPVNAERDPDETLIDDVLQGSTAAFEQLIRMHQGTVRCYLARFARCTETADDLAQEVFVVAYQRLREFKRTSRFSTWLLGIARNKALNHLRGEIRRRKHERQFFDMEVARRQIMRLEDDDRESFDELLAALKSCLESLPEPSSDLVNAFYFKKKSALDIAASANQKSGTIRMKLLRIRSALQKCIAQKTEWLSAKGDG